MKHLSSTSWLLSTLVLFCGCGAGGYSGSTSVLSSSPPATPPSVPSPPGPNIAGNWQFSAISVAGMVPVTIAGSITQSGSSVSGAVHVDGSKCFDRMTTIALTGTLNNKNVSVASKPVAGQVITFSGSISDDALNGSDSAITATYTIEGGCADGDHGNVAGLRIFLGNQLNGTFTTSGGETFDVSSSEAPSGTPSPAGSFAIQGTFSFRTSCFNSGTITPGAFPSGSFIIGMSVALEIATDNGNGTVNFLGTLNRDRSEIRGTYVVSGGTCDQTGTAVLVPSSPWDY